MAHRTGKPAGTSGITKEEYELQCLLRNPTFQEEVVEYYRSVPLLHKILTPQEWKDWIQEKKRHGVSLKSSISPMAREEVDILCSPFVRWYGDRHFALIPTNRDEFDRFIAAHKALDYRVDGILPERDQYSMVTGIAKQTVNNAQARIQQRYPRVTSFVPTTFLAVLWTEPLRAARPTQVTDPWISFLKFLRDKYCPSLSLEQVESLLLQTSPGIMDLINMARLYHTAGLFDTAKIYIPIYEDTRAQDLDFKAIARWQREVYGKKKRAREDKYNLYLRCYDQLVKDRLSLRKIARREGIDRHTALRAIERAFQDILGKRYRKEEVPRESLLDHLKKCSTCSVRENLCPTGESLLNQEVRVQPGKELSIGVPSYDLNEVHTTTGGGRRTGRKKRAD